jgi:phosphomannomutase
MSRPALQVSVSGVRGVVGEALTPSLACDFAAAFGEYVGGGRVIVGRDTRPTGPMFERAVIAGLLSVGCQPVLVGVVPTPTVQIVVDQYSANGGIIITASHNPVEWNALKFIGASGIFLDHTEATELLDVYNQPDRDYVEEDNYRSVKGLASAFRIHQERILAHIDCERIRAARFKVAVDCCNGVGAIYSVPFLRALGCDVVPLFDTANGTFERVPEPIAANLDCLCDAVKANACVLGFAQDPDGDRIALVNSRGEAIGEQYSIVLCAEHVLTRTPGAVVANVQTTRALEDVAARCDSRVYYSPVGEINVTSMMLAHNAVIGGEGSSGGVIWPAVHPCRDSFTAMALVLEMLAERDQTLDDVLATIPHYHHSSAKVSCSGGRAVDVMRALTERYAATNPVTIDGLRIEQDDGWLLIRPSNTEPVIRVFAEGETQARADELVGELQAQIETVMGDV